MASKDTRERWLAPQDGGRGREIRGRWWTLRWFSLRFGAFSYRTRRQCHQFRWFVAEPDGSVVFGLTSFVDDDGERWTQFGVWPLRIDYTPSGLWPRPSSALRQWAELDDE